MREFSTGATRNDDSEKPDYEGFLSPLVLRAYGEYMTTHRRQADGKLRASDNWQKGIPRDQYMKSLLRHVFDLWQLHRGYHPVNPDTGLLVDFRDVLSAIMFNTMGYFLEYLLNRGGNTDDAQTKS